jgi:hypothetical protein
MRQKMFPPPLITLNQWPAEAWPEGVSIAVAKGLSFPHNAADFGGLIGPHCLIPNIPAAAG